MHNTNLFGSLVEFPPTSMGCSMQNPSTTVSGLVPGVKSTTSVLNSSGDFTFGFKLNGKL